MKLTMESKERKINSPIHLLIQAQKLLSFGLMKIASGGFSFPLPFLCLEEMRRVEEMRMRREGVREVERGWQGKVFNFCFLVPPKF